MDEAAIVSPEVAFGARKRCVIRRLQGAASEGVATLCARSPAKFLALPVLVQLRAEASTITCRVSIVAAGRSGVELMAL